MIIVDACGKKYLSEVNNYNYIVLPAYLLVKFNGFIIFAGSLLLIISLFLYIHLLLQCHSFSLSPYLSFSQHNQLRQMPAHLELGSTPKFLPSKGQVSSPLTQSTCCLAVSLQMNNSLSLTESSLNILFE